MAKHRHEAAHLYYRDGYRDGTACASGKQDRGSGN